MKPREKPSKNREEPMTIAEDFIPCPICKGTGFVPNCDPITGAPRDDDCPCCEGQRICTLGAALERFVVAFENVFNRLNEAGKS
jgi:hypothetical protein